MSSEEKLTDPWLVAVWPGMGHVAVSAGYYLMAKLGMHLFAELPCQEFFDIEHVEIKDGIVQMGRLPRSRFWVWKDPVGQRDLVVFIGEAQPPLGKYAFCQRLITFARDLGVRRVFTFAAMATAMHPRNDSRVFGVATDEEGLGTLRGTGLEVLEDGQIGGLNGLVLAAAAEAGMRGACLLGEMPHVLAQVPFPKASLRVLETFMMITGIDLDMKELEEQVRDMDDQLSDFLARLKEGGLHVGPAEEEEEEESFATEEGEGPEVEGPGPEDLRHIEDLFQKARRDRSVAYELKRELDRLKVYSQYEDRFLDLFKAPD